MRKTLVCKQKNSGQPCNVICEITGHERESSLDDYDEIDENQRKELSHIISGFEEVSNKVFNDTASIATGQAMAIQDQGVLLVPIHHVQQPGQMLRAIGSSPDFLAAGFQPWFSGFPPTFPSQFQYRMAASSCAHIPVNSHSYFDCTFNFFSRDSENSQSQRQKKRRAYIIESHEEDSIFKLKPRFAI